MDKNDEKKLVTDEIVDDNVNKNKGLMTIEELEAFFDKCLQNLQQNAYVIPEKKKRKYTRKKKPE
jgi:polyhydroxyalkanoate synthesis regulator phasin